MERTMKLIITGGSGFIGTNAVEHFSKHFEVINIDHQKPQIEEHMKYWRNVDLLTIYCIWLHAPTLWARLSTTIRQTP